MRQPISVFASLAGLLLLMGAVGCGGETKAPPVDEPTAATAPETVDPGPIEPGAGEPAEPTPAPAATGERTGDAYVTRVGMWANKNGEVSGTNYGVGTHIPVNTEVTLLGRTSDAISFTTPLLAGRTVKLMNVEKYTGVNVDTLFERSFARKEIDLSKLSEGMRQSIQGGAVVLGMSREQVLASRGYPPSHKTPSLESNEWRFWINRFNTTVVRFSADGKVIEIVK